MDNGFDKMLFRFKIMCVLLIIAGALMVITSICTLIAV